ncbi:MAG TPA: 50S ribosomal protein L2 [Thermoplasmatales archaeon]|nr:50S ribosomal protein L2 [Thermoplasmatales archaeon]HEX17530.1 50S ribosomal protein L2 [Thermoplasmatales archaeon]
MGKRIISQRRGRGTPKFKIPSHRYLGKVKYPYENKFEGVVEEIVRDAIHSAPIAVVRSSEGKSVLFLATEGIKTGDKIKITDKEVALGNVLPIGNIPEGYPVYNIEMEPGDGGKLVRSAGSYATIVSHSGDKTVIQLPSGAFKTLSSKCRATIGIPAGGGRGEKPFVKAGKKYHYARARGKVYPLVRGVAMNPVSHPHGGGSHQHVGRPSTVSKNAPPGRKVGSIGARRTGRRK